MSTRSTSYAARPISPCVQICQIEPSTSLCLGCGRTLDEIAVWGSMTEAEKTPVWERLEAEGFVADNQFADSQVAEGSTC
ncbi:MAG TPA: DUF1289 domain-containing protein [Halomonas sp.]|nr:DUF1289 domain-containing protein [Halomonas sp.]